MWRKKKQKTPESTRRNARNAASSSRVNSYYTASKKQITTFQRTNLANSHSAAQTPRWYILRQYGIGIIGGLLAVVALVAVLTLSGTVNISIDGGGGYRNVTEYERIIADALAKRPQNKIKFLLDADSVTADIKANLPEAYEVVVYAPLFGRNPEVILTTAAPFAVVLQEGAPTLIMSDRGTLVTEAAKSTVDSGQLPTITNQSGTIFAAGDQLFKPEEMVSLNALQFQYTKGNSQVATTAYQLPQNPREIHVQEGAYIAKYSLQQDSSIAQQFGALRAVQSQLLSQGKTPTEYIDVRLASKVFIK